MYRTSFCCMLQAETKKEVAVQRPPKLAQGKIVVPDLI
jgi:hypothetical protein